MHILVYCLLVCSKWFIDVNKDTSRFRKSHYMHWQWGYTGSWSACHFLEEAQCENKEFKCKHGGCNLASSTHFFSKPSISLSSSIFSSGSHVLCLMKNAEIWHNHAFQTHKEKLELWKYVTVYSGALTSSPILSILPDIQVVPASHKKMADNQIHLHHIQKTFKEFLKYTW